MVAYGFKKYFVPQIEALTKRHTVRGNRNRHARPGEEVQLYYAMRTAHCRKIIPDPVCIKVLPIVIESTDLIDAGIAFIEINGHILNRDEIEEFARADGFGPDWVNGKERYFTADNARANMGAFWRHNHPETMRFCGQLIIWKPQGLV